MNALRLRDVVDMYETGVRDFSSLYPFLFLAGYSDHRKMNTF
jgi:hypothetical protein